MKSIYVRESLSNNYVQGKKKPFIRKRNLVMNFRVSETEKQLIEARIAASGKAKQDFFIESCLYQKILVRGNISNFTTIKKELQNIQQQLKDICECREVEVSQETIISLKTCLDIIEKILK